MARIIPNARVVLTEMDDGTGVLLHMDTKFYYELNETGVFIWKTLAEDPELDITGLANALHETYEVELGRAEQDTKTVIDDLVSEQLIDRA